jgi:hypothetical protein
MVKIGGGVTPPHVFGASYRSLVDVAVKSLGGRSLEQLRMTIETKAVNFRTAPLARLCETWAADPWSLQRPI